MDKWNDLPEWARWILCWPIIVLLTILAGFISMWMASLALDRVWISKSIAEALYPAVATLISGPVFFFLIHEFVPRKQHWVTGFFVFISSALGIMAVIRWYLVITKGLPTDDLLKDILQTLTAVGVSWYWFIHYKNKYVTNIRENA